MKDYPDERGSTVPARPLPSPTAGVGGAHAKDHRGIYEVHNALGFGFLESIYKRALEVALRRRGLLVEREFPIEVFFSGESVGFRRLDLLVERRVIVEVKATHKLAYAGRLQRMNCVTALNLEVGLLLHFGPHPDIKRVVGGWRPAGARSDQR